MPRIISEDRRHANRYRDRDKARTSVMYVITNGLFSHECRLVDYLAHHLHLCAPRKGYHDARPRSGRTGCVIARDILRNNSGHVVKGPFPE